MPRNRQRVHCGNSSVSRYKVRQDHKTLLKQTENKLREEEDEFYSAATADLRSFYKENVLNLLLNFSHIFQQVCKLLSENNGSIDFIFDRNIFKKIIYRVANSFHFLIHLFITSFLFYFKAKKAIALVYKKIFYLFISDHHCLLKCYTRSIFRRGEETLRELFHSLNFFNHFL